MRDLIDLLETVATPDWFSRGEAVNITDEKWDAAEYLEGDEFDYEWRLCMVPTDLVRRAEFKPLATYRETPEERSSAIMSWFGDDPLGRLAESPPVMLWTTTGPHILDGYHRTNLAAYEGLLEIPMLVGLGDSAA